VTGRTGGHYHLFARKIIEMLSTHTPNGQSDRYGVGNKWA